MKKNKSKTKQCYHNDGKGVVFSVNFELVGEFLNKGIKKKNLTETNPQINMTSDHSVSSNNWF